MNNIYCKQKYSTITITKGKTFQEKKHTIFKEANPWKLEIEFY